ncbi:MAG: hypothetical protein M1825_001638 [Sarcosagium campestre]|nr:MAG: hypothetical protein M1825_001638 [Sarcosagium campestre]
MPDAAATPATAPVSASSADDTPPKIEILSLNCWGLKYIARHRRARLQEIGARIARQDPPPQLVGLQECWTQEDYRVIRDQTRAILPYGKFYHSGIFGGGLTILSQWPIEESSMLRYPLNGRPTAFFRGDWFVGKGVACARIRLGPGRANVLEVFNTHLHAPYEGEPNDSYLCHRTAQAWEIAKLMRGAAERGHLVVGMGDFNMLPLSLAHRLITAHAPVCDVWRALHPHSSVGPATNALEMARQKPMPSVEYNLSDNGATCDSAWNTWRWPKSLQKRLDKGDVDVAGSVELHQDDPYAKRLDYIFVGDGQGDVARRDDDDDDDGDRHAWTIERARVGMTERHPTLRCSLSDHFSVEATLRYSPLSSSPLPPAENGVSPPSAENGVSSNDEKKLTTTASHLRLNPTPKLLPTETYDEILAMIRKYTLRELRQRRLRLSHFIVQVTLSIGCLVAVWWAPYNYVAFLLMLLSTLGLAAGTLDGLIGGLFVGSEIRALKEFKWEIGNARARAATAAASSAS